MVIILQFPGLAQILQARFIRYITEKSFNQEIWYAKIDILDIQNCKMAAVAHYPW